MALTLLGGLAVVHLNGVCEQHISNCLMAQHRLSAYLELGQYAWLAEALNMPLPCWTGRASRQGYVGPSQDYLALKKKQSWSEKDYRYAIKTDSDENDL